MDGDAAGLEEAEAEREVADAHGGEVSIFIRDGRLRIHVETARRHPAMDSLDFTDEAAS